MRKKIRPSAIRVLPLLGTLTGGDLRAEIQVYATSGDPAPSAKKIFYFSRQNNSHHRPASFLASVRQDFGERGIQFTTSTDRNDLNLENLNRYDGTFFFGNHDAFTFAQTSALETYLQDGGGMVGMHVIAYVARSNAKLARILGGAFRGHHSISVFTPSLIQSPSDFPTNLESHPNFPFPEGETYTFDPSHPIVEGLSTYTSADEPYLHQNLNPDIILLSYRDDFGRWDEPYTWVRHEGNGRVFYHANGHDSRTWSQTNFRELMIRGTSWSSSAPEQSYLDFLPPIIGPSGKMQHLATVQTASGAQLALHTEGEQTAMTGFQIPGNDESLQFLLTPATGHAVLADSKVVLTTTVQSNNGVKAALLIGHPRYPELIALEDGPADAIEAGFTYSPGQRFQFATDGNQNVVFSAAIQDSAGGNQKRVIALHDGQSVTPLLIEGDPPGDDPLVTVASIPDQTLSYSGGGSLAIIANVGTGQQAPDPTILTGSPDNLRPLVSANSINNELPDDSWVSEFSRAVSPAQDELIFSVKLAGTTINETNDQFIYAISETEEPLIIFAEGMLVNGQPLTIPAGNNQLVARDKDVLIIGSSDDETALISCKVGRDPVILTHENQPIQIDQVEYLIKELDASSLAAEGNQATMRATLQTVEGGMEILTLLQIGSGVVRPLVLEGQEITKPDGSLIIAGIQCLANGPNGSCLRNNEIRISVSSEQGESAIIGISNIDDLDQDGLSDTLQNAFCGSIDRNYSAGYPRLSTDSSEQVQLTYWFPINSGPGLEYTIEASSDLVNWSPVAAQVSSATDQSNLPAGMQRMIATIQSEQAHQFFRFSF